MRKLQTKDPRLVKKYNQRVHEALSKAKLFERLSFLSHMASETGWNQELEDEYNTIQKQQTLLRTQIEYELRKYRKGEVPWSPKLQSYRDSIELWSMIVRKRLGVKVSNRRIRRFIKKTRTENTEQATTELAIEMLKKSHREYKEAKKKAEMWREEFLKTLAEARVENNGTDPAKETEKLLQINRQ